MPSLNSILEGKPKLHGESLSPESGVKIPTDESQVTPGSLSSILKGKPRLEERAGGVGTGERLEAYDPGLFTRIKSLFSDPKAESSKATLAIVDADMQGVTPSQAMRLRHHIDKGVDLDPARARLRSTGVDLVKQSLSKGYAQVNLGLWGSQALMGDNSEETWDSIRRTQAEMPKPEEIAYSDNFVQEFGASAAEMFPFLSESMQRGAWRGLVLAGGVGVLGTLTGTGEVTYPLMPAMYAVGQTSASLEFVGKVEAGLAYVDLLDYTDPETGDKVNPEVARAAAYGVGAINGLIEFAQLKTLISTFPGGKKLLQGLINDTVKEVVQSRALHEIAGRTVTQFGTTIAKETIQEVAQESTNITAEILSRKLTNHLDGTDLSAPEKEEIINRLLETAKTSAQAFTVMALPGSVLTGGTRYYEGRQLTKEQLERQTRAGKAAKASIFEGIRQQKEQEQAEEVPASEINVTLEAQDVETGEIFETVMTAEEAIAENDTRQDAYSKMLECLTK